MFKKIREEYKYEQNGITMFFTIENGKLHIRNHKDKSAFYFIDSKPDMVTRISVALDDIAQFAKSKEWEETSRNDMINPATTLAQRESYEYDYVEGFKAGFTTGKLGEL